MRGRGRRRRARRAPSWPSPVARPAIVGSAARGRRRLPRGLGRRVGPVGLGQQHQRLAEAQARGAWAPSRRAGGGARRGRRSCRRPPARARRRRRGRPRSRRGAASPAAASTASRAKLLGRWTRRVHGRPDPPVADHAVAEPDVRPRPRRRRGRTRRPRRRGARSAIPASTPPRSADDPEVAGVVGGPEQAEAQRHPAHCRRRRPGVPASNPLGGPTGGRCPRPSYRAGWLRRRPLRTCARPRTGPPGRPRARRVGGRRRVPHPRPRRAVRALRRSSRPAASTLEVLVVDNDAGPGATADAGPARRRLHRDPPRRQPRLRPRREPGGRGRPRAVRPPAEPRHGRRRRRRRTASWPSPTTTRARPVRRPHRRRRRPPRPALVLGLPDPVEHVLLRRRASASAAQGPPRARPRVARAAGRATRVRTVDVVTGCLCLVRTEHLAGPRRLRRALLRLRRGRRPRPCEPATAGLRPLLCPEATVVHEVGRVGHARRQARAAAPRQGVAAAQALDPAAPPPSAWPCCARAWRSEPWAGDDPSWRELHQPARRVDRRPPGGPA